MYTRTHARTHRYVINLTLPDVSENYIHRIGRVGRADCMGLAISIVAKGKEKARSRALGE